MCRLSLCRSNAACLWGLLMMVCFALGAFSQRAQAAPALTSGIEFGAAPGRVTLDSGFSLAGRSFTVEAWIWLNNGGADRSILGQMDGTNLLHLLVRNNRVYLGFWNDDLAGGTDVPLGEWVHVAFRYDQASREQSVFLNGQFDGSRIASAPFAENNLPLHIGGYFVSTGNPFDGRILEVRVWDHVRTEAEIADGRFLTPPVNADGLDALFVFEGIDDGNVPEATGNLTGNALHDDVTVVEPALPPALLAEGAGRVSVPVGSLASALAGYTASPAAASSYPDAGAQLTDGVVPFRVWGTPWLDASGIWSEGIVAWENASPELTFHFAERVRIDAVTVYAANSGGASGVLLPEWVHLDSPGGFAASFPVTSGSDIGAIQPIVINNLGLCTEAVTLTLEGAGEGIALGEVTFDGVVLAEPEPTSDWLSLPARRFLGIEPNTEDRAALRLDVAQDATEARFEFPRAADDYGVQAVVEWSTDLVHWEPLPYEPAAEPGREFARLAPPPVEGRAFFRLVFPDAPPSASGPGSFGALESDSPLQFSLPNFLGVDTPLDPSSLQLIAINDQSPSVLGEAIHTASGGILQFLPDGTVLYTAHPGLPGGAIVEETFTYTVADRFGRSVRNEFIVTVVGENDPPVVGNFTGAHASTAVDAGITYALYAGDFPSEASLLAATPVQTGRIATFSGHPAPDASGFGFEFSGELFVPAEGPYTFHTGANHSIVLDVNGTRVVDLAPEGSGAERSGTITLSPGTHTLRVRVFDASGPAALTLEYSGPGFLREAIPANAFPRLADLPLTVTTDPDDGDVLRISHLNGIAVPEGAEAVLPSGATLLLAESGQITYRPAPGRTILHEASETETFTFTVSDAGGLSATGTATIDLARQNTAPVVTGPVNLAPPPDGRISLFAANMATDADGDALRIVRVNGTPLVGGEVRSLPTSAQVFLIPPTTGDGEGTAPDLRYDGNNSFLQTLSQPDGSDAFTLTLVDAAGAEVDVPVAGTWPQYQFAFLIYTDARFPTGSHLGPQTVQLFNPYRFPVEMVTYITDRETGLSYGHQTRTLQSQETQQFSFDLPPGVDLEGAHFFDRFDLEVDTPAGDPIYYSLSSLFYRVEALYSTVSDSFFRITAAASPRWGFEVETVRERATYKSGIYEIATNYGGIAQLFERSILVRGASANKNVLKPSFAANLTIQPICRTRDIARFTIQNLNDEPVPFTVGSGNTVFTVGAGQTKTIEVPYEPKVPVDILDTPLGLFDSSELTCPQAFDFTVTSLCAGSSHSFTQVLNNDPSASYTVRVESVLYPLIRSEHLTIGNQAEAFILMEHQNVNLSGTEGRLIVILPGGIEVEAATFTFSSNPCN